MSRAPLNLDLLNFGTDFADLDDLRARLGSFRQFAPRLYAQGLGRAARTSKTRIDKTARKILNMRRAKSVRSRLKVKPANGAAFAVEAARSVEVIAEEKKGPPNLSSFKKSRQTKAGVKVQPRVGGPVELHKNAFIAKGRGTRRSEDPGNSSENKLVFRRAFEGDQRVGRLPLVTVKGPSVVGLLLGMPGYLSFQQNEFAKDIQKNVLGAVEGFFARRAAARARSSA